MEEKRHLIRFIETSPAFDNSAKLKAILFVSGAKPNTYIHFRVQENIHDKHEFERLLKLNGIVFKTSRAKGFEEITRVSGNKVVWKLKGIWYGYDLFRNKKSQNEFERYVALVKRQKHEAADKLAGKIYGYPSCCIRKFIAEHNPVILPKKYSYYQYYKRLRDSDKAFPFISHTPCSPHCNQSAVQNKKYSAAIKKWAPKFYKTYSQKKTYRVPVIVDIESGTDLWKKRDGHDYVLVTKKPIEGKYYELSWLSKAAFPRGTVLDAIIAIQYGYANVTILKKLGMLKNFHHERKFTIP
ncbi:MAG: hypothetical protein QW165_04225 [Candidatus Woesearchaeota archaeon]